MKPALKNVGGNSQLPNDGFIDIKPHTLTVMFIGIIFLVLQTFFREPSENDLLAYAHSPAPVFDLTCSGIAAACISFLLFSLLQFDDDPYFRRPHPAIWRVVKVTRLSACFRDFTDREWQYCTSCRWCSFYFNLRRMAGSYSS
jgi:hypothetical protein